VGIANKDLAITVKKLNHKLESAGVLECWSAGVLECWSAGVLECWSVGVLECWSNGVLGIKAEIGLI
jgi:hypothetical protein